MLGWISRDGKLILLNRLIRSFGYGFLSILLGIYLKELGFGPLEIGILLSASILGGGIFTIITGKYAVRHGIRKMSMLSVLLGIAGVALFILTNSFVVLLLASLFAFISPSGGELGPFLSLEQAYLPFTVSDRDRTRAFSYWNIASTAALSLGSLLGGTPTLLEHSFGIGHIMSFKAMFLAFIFLNIITLVVYSRMSEIRFPKEKATLSKKSRKIVTKLSVLFALDSFAGGLILTSIISLWFYMQFNAPLSAIAAIFFMAGLLHAVSVYLSAKLAEKIGLINTMVFTHIPAGLLLIALPFMPSFQLAATVYLFRQLLSEMDVPVRQSYVVAMVKPKEKPLASSTTNTARIFAKAVSPSFAGQLLAASIYSNFVIAGVLKIAYDLALYFSFRKLKPPEEK